MSVMKCTLIRLHLASLALVCTLPAFAEAQVAPQAYSWPGWREAALPAFGWILPIVCFAAMLVFMLVMRGGMGCMGRSWPADRAGSRARQDWSALEILNQRFGPAAGDWGAGLCGQHFREFIPPAIGAHLFPYIMLPGGVAEISLTLWLIIVGVNASRWQEKATAWRVGGA